jgi:hypothetical protein
LKYNQAVIINLVAAFLFLAFAVAENVATVFN